MESGNSDVLIDSDGLAAGRTTRRVAVKAGAAIAVGVAAGGYVKPSLRSLGIPAALAASGSQVPGCGSCSIALSLGTVRCTYSSKSKMTTFTGSGTVTQNSDDTSCAVATVSLYIVTGSLSGGCANYNPSNQIPVASFSTTGGTTPLVAGFAIPNPKGATATFTLKVSAAGDLTGKVSLALYATVNDQCQHKAGFNFQTCTTVQC